MKKLLVVGASGLVGSEVIRAAEGLTTLGVARTVSAAATEPMDLLDPRAIARVLSRFEPDAVVIASAWPHVDGCEQDPTRSERENVQTVKNLVHAIGDEVRVVFFSTEHVFDGTQPEYDERAQPKPLSVYAKHKRRIEDLLLSRGNAIVARTSYVFGTETRRKNFMYRVIDAAAEKTPLKVPTVQSGMPTSAPWLANAALTLLKNGFEGIAHLTGPEILTKAQWAKRIATALSLNVEVIEVPWQESGQVAPRPARVNLISTRHDLRHPPLDEVIPKVH